MSFLLQAKMDTIEYNMHGQNLVIVLGCCVNSQGFPGAELICRLERTMRLINTLEDYMLILTGKGNQHITEAKAMEQYLGDKGILLDRILLEEEATSTWENAEYAHAISRNLKITNVFVVSSGHHKRRAVYAFNYYFGTVEFISVDSELGFGKKVLLMTYDLLRTSLFKIYNNDNRVGSGHRAL